MRVLISGSNGLIGSRLVAALAADKVDVVRLVRGGSPSGDRVVWSPSTGAIQGGSLEGFDAVVHLAGESIASGRWTVAKKERILQSRVVGTGKLAENITRLARPPKVMISASAVGFYGDRGDEALDENAPPGTGFLAEVCRDWEEAAKPVRTVGTRLVWMRTGIVLDGSGGALGKMKLPFSLGLGGRLGNGRQYMSWISLDDIVGAIRHAIATADLGGPVNGVGPSPATNAEFTRALGRVMVRPTVFPVPRAAAHLLMGEMADSLLFASQRVTPLRLLATGYRFRHPDLESALRAALGR